MNSYYVTFGVQYAQEIHPSWGGFHPDGWLRVVAEDYQVARAVVTGLLGSKWAFMYEESDFDSSYHPRGELMRITVPA